MKYFRHFSDARTSLKLQHLKTELGLAGYGRYWLLMELLNSKFDGVSTSIEVHYKELVTVLETRSKQSTNKFIQLCHELAIVNIEVLKDQSIVLDCPILFELMDKNSKYNRKKVTGKSQSATLDKEEDKDINKDKEEDKKTESSEIPLDILNTIKTTMMYPEEIIEEVRKDAWLKYQGSSSPDKNWKRFIANYFANEKDKIRNMAVSKGQVVKKPNKSNLATEMASKIYTQILRNGMHGLKGTLQSLDPIEVSALEKFGLASEIINCPSDFQATEIKNRLKAACEQALQSSAEISRSA